MHNTPCFPPRQALRLSRMTASSSEPEAELYSANCSLSCCSSCCCASSWAGVGGGEDATAQGLHASDCFALLRGYCSLIRASALRQQASWSAMQQASWLSHATWVPAGNEASPGLCFCGGVSSPSKARFLQGEETTMFAKAQPQFPECTRLSIASLRLGDGGAGRNDFKNSSLPHATGSWRRQARL